MDPAYCRTRRDDMILRSLVAHFIRARESDAFWPCQHHVNLPHGDVPFVFWHSRQQDPLGLQPCMHVSQVINDLGLTIAQRPQLVPMTFVERACLAWNAMILGVDALRPERARWIIDTPWCDWSLPNGQFVLQVVAESDVEVVAFPLANGTLRLWSRLIDLFLTTFAVGPAGTAPPPGIALPLVRVAQAALLEQCLHDPSYLPRAAEDIVLFDLAMEAQRAVDCDRPSAPSPEPVVREK